MKAQLSWRSPPPQNEDKDASPEGWRKQGARCFARNAPCADTLVVWERGCHCCCSFHFAAVQYDVVQLSRKAVREKAACVCPGQCWVPLFPVCWNSRTHPGVSWFSAGPASDISRTSQPLNDPPWSPSHLVFKFNLCSKGFPDTRRPVPALF